MNKIKQSKQGDLFGETAHYQLEQVGVNDSTFLHIQSGKSVTLSNNYVEEFLSSGVLYEKEEKVNKEDGKDGTLGIRSLFENIGKGEVFTVCFQKQEEVLSDKKYKTVVDAKAKEIEELLGKASVAKKGVKNAAFDILKDLIENPVVKIIPGEMRVLSGWKLETVSRDGRYKCVDATLSGPISDRIRPVNINTIQWLIVGNVKYVIK